ncbi:MAG: hypothetical protein A2W91_03510 [Bacteroidetes bacterium GWF2_38_335]|nr:MAG: hypothetical protein A2W91_03510 [Bacteroidetes bacterium GWF2_38_335]OFY77449.1 MAG: hypothetical protein A2281_01250 [Bacteroidetes bacterium RIFOXYA12_FULL_38_20]HBS87262.1 hypothetical protein [Bacteroidales bacterium]
MKEVLKRIFFIISLITFIVISSDAYSQLSEAEYEMEQAAIEHFKNKQYDKAKENFSQLISVYPKEAFYNYCYGICLVEVNEDIPKAIEYLKYASTKEVKHYVYYFLGKAHQNLYKFSEAITYYEKFKAAAGGSDLTDYPANRNIEMCRNGMALIKYISDLLVMENKVLKAQDFFYSYNLSDFGGNLVVKPDEFKTKLDKKFDDKSVMFLTDNGSVYFGSYGAKGKTGKDIYRSQKLTDGSWGPFEYMGDIINTPFDEDFPFMHPDGKTLYFASKGHNSMGGYDIFRTEWDSINNKWMNPVNMDFPTNSPYDDILYVSDLAGDYAFFASARETNQSQVSVYKIRVDKNPRDREFRDLEEIMNLSKLNEVPLADLQKYEQSLNKQGKNQQTKNNGSEKKSYDFQTLPFDPGLTTDDVKKESDADINLIKNDINQTKKESNLAYINASDKNKEANKKRQEALSIYDIVKEIKDDEERKEQLKKAQQLENEADVLSDEAVVSYNLAKNLDKNATEKENTLNEAVKFNESINSGSKPEDLVTDLNNLREKLNLSDNKYTSTSEQLAERKADAENKSQQLSEIATEKNSVNQINFNINNDIDNINHQLKSETNSDAKADLENQLADLKKEQDENKNKINQLNEKEQKLRVDVEKTNKEVEYLATLEEKSKSPEISDADLNNQVTSINKEELNKEIFDKELTADLNKAKEIAENIKNTENTTLADNNTTTDNTTNPDNTNNPVNDETSNIKVDDNTNEALKSYKNPEARNLFIEARQNKIMADSLQDLAESKRYLLETVTDPEQIRAIEDEVIALETQATLELNKGNREKANELNKKADNKRNQLKTIEDDEERTDLESEIKELETLADEKRQNAINKFTDAQIKENNLTVSTDNTNVPDNSNAPVKNITLDTKDNEHLLTDLSYITADPKFPFKESAGDSDLDKFNKAKYKEQYYTDIVNIIEPRLEKLKKVTDTISDPNLKSKYETERTRLDGILLSSRDKALTSSATVNDLKKELLADIGTKEIPEDTHLEEKKYVSANTINYNEKQQNDLKLIQEDRTYAKSNLDRYNSLNSEIANLNKEIEKTNDHREKKVFQDQIDEKTKEAAEAFTTYNKLNENTNKTEYLTNKEALDLNRSPENNDKNAKASALTSEGTLYYEKAQSIRADAEKIEDTGLKNDQLAKADRFETHAIANQKKAMDILYPIGENLVVDNKNNGNKTLVVVDLSPEEKIKSDNANAERVKAQNNVTDAQKTLDEVETKREKANAIYSEKKQKSLLKGTEEKELEAKQDLIEAYKNYGEADKVKYDLNNNQINQLYNALSDVGNNKAISNQFKKEADFSFNEAQRLRAEAEKTQDPDQKITLLKKAVGFEEKALYSQSIAMNTLMDNESSDFVVSNELKKMQADSINVDNVIKLSTKRIVSSMNLPEDELKALDKTTEVNEVIFNLKKDAEVQQAQINELKFTIENSNNQKDISKAKKELEKIEKKQFATLFTEAELAGSVSNSKYWIYKDHMKEFRTKGNSEQAQQGRELEKEADSKFRKAQTLRERAFMDEKAENAFKKLKEAKELEEAAIYDQEKAYSVYLGLTPLEEEIAAYKLKKEQEKADNELVVRSTADITPVDVDTLFPNYKNQPVDSIPVDTAEVLADNTNPDNTNPDNVTVDNTNPDNVTVDNTNPDNTNPDNTNPDNTNPDNVTVDNTNPDNVTVDTTNTDNTNPDNVTVDNTNPDNTNPDNVTVDNTNPDNTNPDNTNPDNVTVDNTNPNNTESTPALNTTTIQGTNVTIPAKAIFSYSVSKTGAASSTATVALNQELPAGIVFKVQIGAFKRELPANTFPGLAPISAEKLANSTFIKYLVGLFQTFEAAGVALTQVKTKGYSDAFIVAYKDGKRISLYEARNMIKSESADVKKYYDAVAKNEIDIINKGGAVNDVAVNNNPTNNSNPANNSAVNNASANNTTNEPPVNATNITTVSDLLYTVQIGVYKTPVSAKALYNLKPIYSENTDNGYIRYTTGIFNEVGKAIVEKDKIVNIGIRDAFVTAYYKGKRITLSEAARIAGSGANVAGENPTNSETIPVETNTNPTVNSTANNKIEFKIQIGAYKEQVPTNVVKDLLKVSAHRGLDQQVDENGFTVYTVGKYTTYNEAKSMKEELVREGIGDAFVTAFNNGKKISVEEALRLIQ